MTGDAKEAPSTMPSSHRSTRRWLVPLCLAPLLIPLSADAGEVRAKLQWPSALPEAIASAPPKAYWEEWNGLLPPAPPRFDPGRHLAVVLRGPSRDAPKGCEGALRGGGLYPETLLVRAGTELRIVNTDGTPHELFAEELEGFGPLSTAPGNARTVPVPEAGKWAVADRRFPHVRGHLVALPDLVACGQIDARGEVRFEDIQPGRYTLEVYLDGEAVLRRSLQVPAEGTLQLPDPLPLPAP